MAAIGKEKTLTGKIRVICHMCISIVMCSWFVGLGRRRSHQHLLVQIVVRMSLWICFHLLVVLNVVRWDARHKMRSTVSKKGVIVLSCRSRSTRVCIWTTPSIATTIVVWKNRRMVIQKLFFANACSIGFGSFAGRFSRLAQPFRRGLYHVWAQISSS